MLPFDQADGMTESAARETMEGTPLMTFGTGSKFWSFFEGPYWENNELILNLPRIRRP